MEHNGSYFSVDCLGICYKPFFKSAMLPKLMPSLSPFHHLLCCVNSCKNIFQKVWRQQRGKLIEEIRDETSKNKDSHLSKSSLTKHLNRNHSSIDHFICHIITHSFTKCHNRFGLHSSLIGCSSREKKFSGICMVPIEFVLLAMSGKFFSLAI